MTAGTPATDEAVRLLRELGLTATEAEVYCAALQAAVSEPVSSYKLAQAMGRDPANVGKILAALVHRDAMAVVQDKPRLYLPTAPDVFTARIRARLVRHARDAAAALEDLRDAPERPEAVGLALADPEAVFARARTLLAGCGRRAVVFGAKECLREIGAELEAAAEPDDREVLVLSPAAMQAEHAMIAVFSPLSGLGDLPGRDFLQLVVDDRAWLAADLGPDAPVPCGWWSDHSPAARVLAGSLTLAWHAGHAAGPRHEVAPCAPAPEPEPGAESAAESAPIAASEPAPTPEPAPAAPVAPQPPAPVETPSAASDEGDDGLTFLVRHDRRPG
ncbi:hypothetical protein KDM41_00400 [bacterium]|nr:hypothetical protein [bacterium]